MKHEDLHTEDELKKAPILGSLNRRDPFVVPDAYFQNFSQRLEQAIEDWDILEEAPHLRKASKRTPFQVPEGYEQQFRDRIADLIEDEEVLEQAPLLKKAGKKEIFQAPDGFLKDFNEKIASQIETEESSDQKNEAQVINIWGHLRKPRYAIGIAAVILVLLTAIWIIRSSPVTGPEIAQNSDEITLTDEEILATLELEGVDAFYLAEALVEQQPADNSFGMEFSDEELEGLADELDASDLEGGLLEGI